LRLDNICDFDVPQLKRIVEFREKPEGIKVDNGPEFTGRALHAWREDYNDERPHKSLGNLTPIEFAKLQAEKLQLNNPEFQTLETIQ